MNENLDEIYKRFENYKYFIYQIWDTLNCKGAGGGVDNPNDPNSTNQIVLKQIDKLKKFAKSNFFKS